MGFASEKIVELFVITVQEMCMQSKIVAMLVPDGCAHGTVLVRRSNGQFAYQLIDARVALASRLASSLVCGDTNPNQAPRASMA